MTTPVRVPWAHRVGDELTSWVDHLPQPLRRLLPKNLVGFALIGGFTFLIDFSLLWLIESLVQVPVAIAATSTYLIAYCINFALNRTINFRSKAPIGRQAALYALVVAGDYAITISVTWGLAALGIDYRISRLIAAATVAAYTYSGARFVVFREGQVPTRRGLV